jgi:hypothetical protein
MSCVCTCIHIHTHIYLVVVGGGGAVSVYVVHVLLRDLARLQARLKVLHFFRKNKK